MKRIAYIGIGLALTVTSLGLVAVAQGQAPSSSQSTGSSNAGSSNSGSSLGDYARQIRKAPATASKPKVFDNDNLPTEDKLSVVGQAPADDSGDAKAADTSNATSNAAPAPADAKAQTDNKAVAPPQDKTASTAKTPEEDQAAKQAAWKQWGEKIASQKDQIDLLTRELNVLQREYQIRAAAMYGDVGNRMRNSTDWDKQDAQYKQQIADKQKAVDDAQQKLAEMQEEARKAGVPSSIAEP